MVVSPKGATDAQVSDWSLLERVIRKDEAALSALYERFDPQRGSRAGWLLVATRNRAISKLRKKSGKARALDENGVMFVADVESHAAQRVLLDKVQTLIADLPEGQRVALECAYFEGMSHAEIAEKIGQPLGAVKTRIRNAMETLKKVLR